LNEAGNPLVLLKPTEKKWKKRPFEALGFTILTAFCVAEKFLTGGVVNALI